MLEFIQVAHAASSAASTANEGGVAGTLGINLKLFIAQLVNFAIVFWILWKLVFKNIIATLNERQKKIEESLANAKKVEENLTRSEADYQEKIKLAKAEANAMIQSAEEKALQAGAKIKEKTKEELAQTIAQAKATISAEKEQMLTETKQIIADMVINTTEKLLREKLDATKDKQLIEKLIT